MKPPEIPPPDHLGDAGKKFWREITAEYGLEAHDMARLEIACDCLDRIAQARKVLAKGLDRVAANVWRDSSKLFLVTTKHLGLDKADHPQPSKGSSHK